MAEQIALAGAFFGVALLFASTGHGGASGYLAVMALAGIAPPTMRPAALLMNVIVASIGTWRYAAAGCFSWRLFWPFAAASVPCAFAGGLITLHERVFSWIVGAVLAFAAWRLWVQRASPGEGASSVSADSPTSGGVGVPPVRTKYEQALSESEPRLGENAPRLGETTTRQRDADAPARLAGEVRAPALGIALASGAGIGLLSGLVGVGGGIFLSPLVLLAGWADARRTAGVSAAFILVNSISGLIANHQKAAALTGEVLPWALAALVGGWIGAGLGARRFSPRGIRRVLAAVLVVAAAKMVIV